MDLDKCFESDRSLTNMSPQVSERCHIMLLLTHLVSHDVALNRSLVLESGSIFVIGTGMSTNGCYA